MLAVEGLTKSFGGFRAVNGVSFEVRRGEILGLIGPNGSGKSTTFNLIAGTLRPTAGSIRFDGTEIGGIGAHMICRQGIARTFQIPRPFRKLSLLENVMLAAHYGGAGRLSPAEARRRAEERWRRGRACFSPTKASADWTQPRWSTPLVCLRPSAAAWISPSSGWSTSWAC
jgi:branched-chain amino acid transport system ATP-binding protein